MPTASTAPSSRASTSRTARASGRAAATAAVSSSCCADQDLLLVLSEEGELALGQGDPRPVHGGRASSRRSRARPGTTRCWSATSCWFATARRWPRSGCPRRLADRRNNHDRPGADRVMQPEIHTNEDRLVAEFVARMNGAGDGPAAREAIVRASHGSARSWRLIRFRDHHPSVVFESAAKDREEPLRGLSAAGHRCRHAPLPALRPAVHSAAALSFARFQRAMLLRTIRYRSLILANAGSERTRGADHTVVARQDADGIRIDGTFEYMSLATVADVVFFKARLANSNGTVLCAADLRADWCASEVGDSPEACGCRTHRR